MRPTLGARPSPAKEKNVCANRPQLSSLLDELTKPAAGPAVHLSRLRPFSPVGSVPEMPTPQRPHGWLNNMRSNTVVSANPVAPEGEEVTLMSTSWWPQSNPPQSALVMPTPIPKPMPATTGEPNP